MPVRRNHNDEHFRGLNQNGDQIVSWKRTVMVPKGDLGIGKNYFPQAKAAAGAPRKRLGTSSTARVHEGAKHLRAIALGGVAVAQPGERADVYLAVPSGLVCLLDLEGLVARTRRAKTRSAKLQFPCAVCTFLKRASSSTPYHRRSTLASSLYSRLLQYNL